MTAVEVRGPRTDWSTTSFSELSLLASCEMRWHHKYRLRRADEGSAAMALGGLTHSGVNTLFGIELSEEDVQKWAQADPEVRDHAEWLIARYKKHYADLLRNVAVEATELKLEIDLPFRLDWNGQQVKLKLVVDQLLRINGHLWATERKTMGRWDRLDLIDVDPQITLYDWALKELGYPIYGVLFDAIRTYRWALEKPTQAIVIAQAEAAGQTWPTRKARTEWAREAVARHPGVETHEPAESFQQVWTDRNAHQHKAGLGWAETVLNRRDTLLQPYGPEPIRNIGNNCKGCPFQLECFEGMSFENEITVEP